MVLQRSGAVGAVTTGLRCPSVSRFAHDFGKPCKNWACGAPGLRREADAAVSGLCAVIGARVSDDHARYAPMSAVSAMALQRSTGEARLRFDGRGSATRLRDLYQQGAAKAFIHAAPSGSAGGPEVVFLNTSGGVTGGDRLSYGLELGAGCRLTATTQTAERAYGSLQGRAQVSVRHRLQDGAHLDWLPQETILFDNSALERRTDIALEGCASCLLIEPVVLGRAAMGETVTGLVCDDRRCVTRDGVPVLIEPLRLVTAALTAGAGILEGARAFATLALLARGAEDALARARAELTESGVRGGASGFDGKLVIRLMAMDGWPLRRQIMRLLAALRPAPLPRVWHM